MIIITHRSRSYLGHVNRFFLGRYTWPSQAEAVGNGERRVWRVKGTGEGLANYESFDPPASSSKVLGLGVWATAPSSKMVVVGGILTGMSAGNKQFLFS